MNGTAKESMVGSVVVGGDRDADHQEDEYNDGDNQHNGTSRGKRKRASTSTAGGFLGLADITMKLAKRNGGLPHLCLDAKNNGGRGLLGIEAHYAIPVRIMRTDELQ